MNKTVVVTGGTRGIGAGVAGVLAGAGWSMCREHFAALGLGEDYVDQFIR